MRKNLRNFLGIVGLGYVGLPLAVEFSKKYLVIGFDINPQRVKALQAGKDKTLEISDEELRSTKSLKLTSDPNSLNAANVFIVTVPTPIDASKRPDLSPLLRASEAVGNALKIGDVVIYESTVYPGATEEDCVPVLELTSGLSFNRDFFVGYSPERINPGDKVHRLKSICKVTSGSTPKVADFVDALYREIITAGTHKAPSIRVAEAAKVIENTQRDVNIALVNELAMIFDKMEIDTREVLEAASTKWNFLNFKPGLVGGHCIGVDPYYLTYKSQLMGYSPELILAGRKINSEMIEFVAKKVFRLFEQNAIKQQTANVLILGLTFKEDCPDTRNSKIFDLVSLISQQVGTVEIFDPFVVEQPLQFQSNVSLTSEPKHNHYDAIIVAVRHAIFIEWGIEKIRSFGNDNSVIFDLKYCFEACYTDGQT